MSIEDVQSWRKKSYIHTNSAQNIIDSNADAHRLIVMCGLHNIQ